MTLLTYQSNTSSSYYHCHLPYPFAHLYQSYVIKIIEYAKRHYFYMIMRVPEKTAIFLFQKGDYPEKANICI